MKKVLDLIRSSDNPSPYLTYLLAASQVGSGEGNTKQYFNMIFSRIVVANVIFYYVVNE